MQFKHKKGSALDLIWFVVVIFLFAVIVMLGFKMINSFNTQISSMTDIPIEVTTELNEVEATFPTVIDNSVLLLLVFGSIAILVLASLVRIHPIFIPVYIVSAIILIIFAAALSNTYETLATHPALAATASQLTITNKIMLNLPKIAGAIGFILMIVMYKSWSNDQPA